MDTNDIVVEIDAEISRLQQARALLSSTATTVKRKPGRPAGASFPSKTKAVHTMSAEARAKIAAAQKARWAKTKKAAKKEARAVAATPAVKRATPNGVAPKTAPVKKAVTAKKSGQSKTKTPITPAA
jgi:hypothetical protein